VEKLPDTAKKITPKTKQLKFISKSKKLKRPLGLVWIVKPSKTGAFTIYLRGEKNSYPQRLLKNIQFKNNCGYYHYPIFPVRDEEGVKAAMKLIQYAYDNL
jgi:hypothetical protein